LPCKCMLCVTACCCMLLVCIRTFLQDRCATANIITYRTNYLVNSFYSSSSMKRNENTVKYPTLPSLCPTKSPSTMDGTTDNIRQEMLHQKETTAWCLGLGLRRSSRLLEAHCQANQVNYSLILRPLHVKSKKKMCRPRALRQHLGNSRGDLPTGGSYRSRRQRAKGGTTR
jgi:hypothetical protein